MLDVSEIKRDWERYINGRNIKIFWYKLRYPLSKIMTNHFVVGHPFKDKRLVIECFPCLKMKFESPPLD